MGGPVARAHSLTLGRATTLRREEGVKLDFSRTSWRWLYWLRMVPVAPTGNYLVSFERERCRTALLLSFWNPRATTGIASVGIEAL